MDKVFIFGLFLLYFWYFYFSYSKKPLPKPLLGSPTAAKVYRPQFISSKPNHFQFEIDGSIVWEEMIPQSYAYYQGQLVQQDECQSIPDGGQILAKGYPLYNYLKTNSLTDDHAEFKSGASSIVQKGDVFYFTCKGGRIDQFHICPSGQVFFKGKCQPIRPCMGKADGTLLPDKDEKTNYIRCHDQEEHFETCPHNTFFSFNKCSSMDDLIHYCQFFNESFLLDSKTRVECVRGKPVFTKCPSDFQFFDTQECEPMTCVGQPNGTKIPLPTRRDGPLQYIPGYIECQNDRIAKSIECPQAWDTQLSKGENLTHLPMVFNLERCAIPELCTNVFSTLPDTLVPVHEFTKHVANWEDAEYYDSLVGYDCNGSKRRRVQCAPGKRIKRFKVESACDDPKRPLVPVAESPNEYFDCASQTKMSCKPGEQFNGYTCRSLLGKPFNFNGVDLFQFDSLSFDNWIKPWIYSKEASVQPCPDKYVYISAYNLCSHPDCVHYPFLAQIPSLSILHPDKTSKCTFTKERILEKELVDFNYHFWSQRRVENTIPTDQEPCRSGQRIQTGSFVWDSTLFATCDMDQPFVFCPSSDTLGIFKAEGKRFACQPSPHLSSSVFYDDNWTLFEPNEIKTIKPSIFGIPQSIKLNHGESMDLPIHGIGMKKDMRVNLKVDQPVILEYWHRVSHPPDVAFENGHPKVSTNKDLVFLMRRADFTARQVDFPKYTVQPFVPNFKSELYI